MGTKPARCLVVEDDEDCRWVVMRALMKLSIKCEAARNGEHALELLSGETFDVVVTDLRMPKKHGFNLASEIFESYGEKAPAIMVYTGIEEPKLVAQLLAMGVEDVCIKPMNPDILAAKVLAVVQKRLAGAPAPASASKSPTRERKVVKLSAS
jgi:DNA-binding response OmpR family regulator